MQCVFEETRVACYNILNLHLTKIRLGTMIIHACQKHQID